LRRTWFCSWFALGPFLLGAATPVSFGLKPESATISPQAKIAEFQFSSLYAQPVVFQVTIAPRGADFIVVPGVFRITPYETRLIRIALRTPALPAAEERYTVSITQVVPGAATPPPAARRFTAALVVTPIVPAGSPQP